MGKIDVWGKGGSRLKQTGSRALLRKRVSVLDRPGLVPDHFRFISPLPVPYSFPLTVTSPRAKPNYSTTAPIHTGTSTLESKGAGTSGQGCWSSERSATCPAVSLTN